MNTIITIITSVALSIGSFLGITSTQPTITPEIRNYVNQEIVDSNREIQISIQEYINKSKADSVILGSTLPIAGSTYTLSGSGVTSSATSITLTSLTLSQNGYEIVDGDLSDTFYLTLEPGNRTRQEIIGCTTVTQNANNTATLSGCSRGLSPVSPYTASTSLQFSHAGGAQVIFSDPPQLFNQYTAKDNNETITGTWTFSTFPITPNNGTSSETVAGVVELATGAEAAASTLTGATTARLALSTAIATSTYNSATAGNVIPVTGLSSKTIDENFLPATTTKIFEFATTTYIGDFPAYNIGKNRQIITTTGTTTFTVPSGISTVFVEVVGPGGTGGNGANNSISGGGGGGGGYSNEYVDVTGTSTIQVYVGVTGIGQRSTFGTNGFYLSATGGSNGQNGVSGGNGGAGGVGSGGDLNISGGGGGAGGSNSTSETDSGVGGSSHYGGGGAGIGGNDITGSNGGNYGGGGSGGTGTAGGGSGAQGAVIISW